VTAKCGGLPVQSSIIQKEYMVGKTQVNLFDEHSYRYEEAIVYYLIDELE